ncbi:MAG: tetratricopeptide (TPR) repeat protein [Flavobacteriales bacterium]
MKDLLKYISFLLLVFTTTSLLGQADLELADYYYKNGEYQQAKLYYDKIWKSNQSNAVYENYLGTLIGLGALDEAEKLVKRKIRSKRDNATAHVDLGALYLQFDQDEKAKDEFDQSIKLLEPGRSTTVSLANAFIKLSLYEYALETYLKGRKTSNDGYEFHYEIANVSGMMGKYDEMVDSFMDLLITSPRYIQTVQNSLNRNLSVHNNDENYEMIRIKLIKRIQRYPDQTIYNELLIWVFNQRKDFASSLVQAEALDKRLSENGLRVMEIGNMARGSSDYLTARQAYEYVATKGRSNEYYTTAITEMLEAHFAELNEAAAHDAVAYQELASKYEAALTELGKTGETAIMMKELAHIYAFNLGEPEQAMRILQQAIEVPGVYGKIQAHCKLELADILLLEGDIWEASLLYSQVELKFKEDPLGHEAKFRNARISYFTGDFEWAQAQLDVLKASTTKLISNDAIDLSLLITDNFNMDTTTVPMMLYAQADLLTYQNRFDEAIAKVDSLLAEWPVHTLKDEILMLKSDIFMREGNFAKAQTYLEEVAEFHFHDILADDAIFKLAELHHYIYADETKAMEYYEKLLTEYPGSLYVVEARKRFRALRGDNLE